MRRRWDVFCKVVDHYGDAGVCWRLARLLACEHACDVRLWIDGLDALSRIDSRVRVDALLQRVAGIDVRRFRPLDSRDEIPDAVVEAFGCGLPASYLDAMEAEPRAPVWINLEYLSAEPWVDGVHGLPSRDPRRALTRHFFVPGFSAASGGLLRERDLFAARDAFVADARARLAFLSALGARELADDARIVSIYVYDAAPILALFEAWASAAAPTHALVTEGVIADALALWSEGALRHAGDAHRRGALTVTIVPFVAQDDYDRLLWSASFNIVRGEDSFVRAQWAARPLAWQPYRQAGDAHAIKLDAFLARYVASLPDALRAATIELAQACDGRADARLAWRALEPALPALEAHARAWALSLSELPELASTLVRFVASKV